MLLVAGVTFYMAKRSITERRKAELDQYRACKLLAILACDSRLSESSDKNLDLCTDVGLFIQRGPWVGLSTPNLSAPKTIYISTLLLSTAGFSDRIIFEAPIRPTLTQADSNHSRRREPNTAQIPLPPFHHE